MLRLSVWKNCSFIRTKCRIVPQNTKNRKQCTEQIAYSAFFVFSLSNRFRNSWDVRKMKNVVINEYERTPSTLRRGVGMISVNCCVFREKSAGISPRKVESFCNFCKAMKYSFEYITIFATDSRSVVILWRQWIRKFCRMPWNRND